jgi:hypothetical protein
VRLRARVTNSGRSRGRCIGEPEDGGQKTEDGANRPWGMGARRNPGAANYTTRKFVR